MQIAYTFYSPSAEGFSRSLPADFVDYLPFDTFDDAEGIISALRPSALVFSKLDIWPLLTERAAAARVPVGVISATLPNRPAGAAYSPARARRRVSLDLALWARSTRGDGRAARAGVRGDQTCHGRQRTPGWSGPPLAYALMRRLRPAADPCAGSPCRRRVSGLRVGQDPPNPRRATSHRPTRSQRCAHPVVENWLEQGLQDSSGSIRRRADADVSLVDRRNSRRPHALEVSPSSGDSVSRLTRCSSPRLRRPGLFGRATKKAGRSPKMIGPGRASSTETRPRARLSDWLAVPARDVVEVQRAVVQNGLGTPSVRRSSQRFTLVRTSGHRA